MWVYLAYLTFLKCKQVWKMIVPLWSHTSVILCKGDLHIFCPDWLWEQSS